MKHLSLVLLLAIAPLSWGEDVYYCVEELRYKLEDRDSDGLPELQRYQAGKFTFKYEADLDRLAFKGTSWAGDDIYYMDCGSCYPERSKFSAADIVNKFAMSGDRFFVAGASRYGAVMETGTCTKF